MLFSHLSDRLPDVPDALRRGFEGSGREHVWSAAEDDSRHYWSLLLIKLMQNSLRETFCWLIWLRNHHVDKSKHLKDFHVKLLYLIFPSLDLSKKRKFPEPPTVKSGYLEGGASGRLPRIMDEDVAAKSNRWWRHDMNAKDYSISYSAPGAGLCFLSCGPLRDQSKYDMIDDFHIRQRGQMCCDSQRKHAEKCDLQDEPTASPTPILSMQVWLCLPPFLFLLLFYAKLYFLCVLFKYKNAFRQCLNLDLPLNEMQKHNFLYSFQSYGALLMTHTENNSVWKQFSLRNC